VQRVDYPPLFQELVRQLRRMPGVGPRSAERIALWTIQSRDARPQEIAQALLQGASGIHNCAHCGFFTEQEICVICADPGRDRSLLCVVEQPTDILPLERAAAYRGLYHALGGKLSPLDNINAEDLRIDSLLHRVETENPREVILATGADVEGEATANYISDLLRAAPVQLTRLAQGLPAGLALESADDLTIARALSGRVVVGRTE
jgi:recombination protein RecR